MIESAGYDGTVTQEDWAKMAQFAGVDTAVAGATDCVVTGVAGSRAVSVSPGVAWGWGVLDTLTSSNTVSLAANGTGSTRWDAIVLRRNWSTGATTLAAVTGGATEAIPALTVNPGVTADQLLALVAVPAGATSLDGAVVRRWAQWPVQMTSGPRAPHNPSQGQRWGDSATGRTYEWNGSGWVDTSSTPLGGIIMWGGSAVPDGYHLCDGSLHGSSVLASIIGSTRTPDLRDRFIVGAGGAYQRGDVGGSASVQLTAAQSGMPAHGHSASAGTDNANHSHPGTTNSANRNGSHGHANTVGGQSANHEHHGFTGDQTASHVHYAGNASIPFATSYGDLNVGAAAGTARAGVNGTVGATDVASNGHAHEFYTEGYSRDHNHAVDIQWTDTNHEHAFTTGGRDALHSHSVSVGTAPAAGAAEAHENRPPFYAVTFIMRKA